MKKLFAIALTAISLNSFAIQFITENQVADALEADKVIEVNKQSIKELLEKGSACENKSFSRSARAYVVRKGKEVKLVITSEGLDDLTACKAL